MRLKSDGNSSKLCVTIYGRAFRYVHGVLPPPPPAQVGAPASPTSGLPTSTPGTSSPVPLVKP